MGLPLVLFQVTHLEGLLLLSTPGLHQNPSSRPWNQDNGKGGPNRQQDPAQPYPPPPPPPPPSFDLWFHMREFLEEEHPQVRSPLALSPITASHMNI